MLPSEISYNTGWLNPCSTIVLVKDDMTVALDLFSASEPRVQVHYCDHALPVARRPSVRRR